MTTLDPMAYQLPPTNSEAAGKTTKTASMDSQQDFGRWLPHNGPEALPGSTLPPGEGEQSIGTIIPPPGDLASEGVLYEWQLHSQRSLSQVLAGPRGEEEVSACGPLSASSRRQLVHIPSEVPAGSVGNAATTHGMLQAGSPLLAATLASSPNEPSPTRKAAASMANAVPPAFWAERLLRTVEAADRSITIWLRDYRLGKEQLPATVDEILMTHADAERVTRVVVNGDEVWRKNPLQSRSE